MRDMKDICSVALALIDEAANRPDLIVFPELFISCYPCGSYSRPDVLRLTVEEE